ncbi:protein quiver-like [Pollicipes pollicipes]|uniref:protein quiver-like n=1 Tax=Pollicipes pollicipes TaxID=41117 RepID=UPI001884BC25|nr:protein quiver-like [Pollicipes pollicipes]XP_037069345.1 protein quiver-like [Pollicipes pollicipes]
MNFLYEISVLLLLCAVGGLAIRCFECNSWYDRWCADPFKRKEVGSVDCEDKITGAHLDGLNSTICRKIVHHVGNHHRIVRSCGWVDDREVMAGRDCMKKAGTYQVAVYYCSCYEDLCNSASDHKMSLLLLLSAGASWLHYLRA